MSIVLFFQVYRVMKSTDAVIKLLLQNRPASSIFSAIDINNIVDPVHFFRPLHLAVMYSNTKDTFIHLLKNGASLHAPDRNGDTPLSLAAKYNKTELWEAISSLYHQECQKNAQMEQTISQIKQERSNLMSSLDQLRVEVETLRTRNNDLKDSFENVTSSLRKKRKIDDCK